MSEGPPFSLPTFNRRKTQPTELDVVLEQLPRPALLVDAKSRHILSANTHLSDLTQYPRSELKDLNLGILLADHDAAFLKTWLSQGRVIDPAGEAPASQPAPIQLSRRDGSHLLVNPTLMLLPPKGKQVLVILEEADAVTRREAEKKRVSSLWENLSRLAGAPQKTSFQAALSTTLQAGLALTGADALAVYKANQDLPGLGRMICQGNEDLLPAELQAQDLMILNKPAEWKPGRRVTAGLHRSARAGQLAHLFSAPLIQGQARFGLVVAAYKASQPPESGLIIMQMLAATLTSLVDEQARTDRLDNLLNASAISTAIHQTLENGILSGLLILSPELLIMSLNPAAERMLGYTSREVIGAPADDILIGAHSLLPTLQEVQANRIEKIIERVHLYHRGGDPFLARIRLLPVLQAEGLARLMVLVQDLREQEHTREHIQQLEQRASLGEIVAVFAHEVRNPINNISTGLELMALNLPPEDPNQEILKRMQTDCNRLEDLMSSVLSYSRATDYEYEMAPVRLPELLSRLLERSQARLNRAKVLYNLQAENNCPPVLGNGRALEQVFSNLINNALQAMQETGGRLAVRVQTTNPSNTPLFVEVTVADTGPGIPKDIQDHIFEPFYTTNRNRSGTGLGLAIAKRIITAHKGAISLTSFPGGTVFQIRIPATV